MGTVFVLRSLISCISPFFKLENDVQLWLFYSLAEHLRVFANNTVKKV